MKRDHESRYRVTRPRIPCRERTTKMRNRRRRCVICGLLTHHWQRINGGDWHCYDGCFSTTGRDRRTCDGRPQWCRKFITRTVLEDRTIKVNNKIYQTESPPGTKALFGIEGYTRRAIEIKKNGT